MNIRIWYRGEGKKLHEVFIMIFLLNLANLSIKNTPIKNELLYCVIGKKSRKKVSSNFMLDTFHLMLNWSPFTLC